MDRFINTENIKNYRKLLSDPNIDRDPARRVMLVRLLAGELAKDAASWVAVHEADQLETELMAGQPELSGVAYWAAMHRDKP